MAKTYLPLPQPDGSVNVRVEEDGKVSRYVLTPGAFTDAVTFVATDLNAQPANVRGVCESMWTPEVIAAWKLSHPWVAPPVPSVDEQRQAAVRLNARRVALIAAIQNNDDAGLIAAVQARYPSLPANGDAMKAIVDIVLLIAGGIRN